MPVELTIVQSVTDLETILTDVILESASAPGPAGANGTNGTNGADGADGVGVPVGGNTDQVLAKASNTDFDTEWVDQTGGGGASDAADVTFTPAGNIASTDVQAALEELDTEKATPANISSAIAALSTVYQPLDSDLTSIAALTTTSYGRAFLALADAAAARTALALGTAATSATGDFDAAGAAAAAQAASQPVDSDLTAIAALTTTSFGRGLLALADAAAARTALGLVIGTDVQAHDSDLDTWAGLTPSAFFQTLIDDANASASRTTLGLVIGTDVQAHDADLDTYAGITPSANVQTLLGAASYAAMRTQLGLVVGTDVEAHDTDLTTIAGLSPTNDDILQRKSGAWANRTLAQLITDLNSTGGITATAADPGADFAFSFMTMGA